MSDWEALKQRLRTGPPRPAPPPEPPPQLPAQLVPADFGAGMSGRSTVEHLPAGMSPWTSGGHVVDDLDPADAAGWPRPQVIDLDDRAHVADAFDERSGYDGRGMAQPTPAAGRAGVYDRKGYIARSTDELNVVGGTPPHWARSLELRVPPRNAAGRPTVLALEITISNGEYATYRRKFHLHAGNSPAIFEVRPGDTVRLDTAEAVEAGATNVEVEVAWYEAPPVSDRAPLNLWENAPATGVDIAVPEGASHVYLQTADAGFAWRAPFVWAESIPANTRVAVKGPTYRLSVGSNIVLWEITPR